MVLLRTSKTFKKFYPHGHRHTHTWTGVLLNVTLCGVSLYFTALVNLCNSSLEDMEPRATGSAGTSRSVVRGEAPQIIYLNHYEWHTHTEHEQLQEQQQQRRYSRSFKAELPV